MASLTVETGQLTGKQVEVGRERLVIGRAATAHLVLPTSLVSGQHCAVVPKGERYVLQDLNSTNGTRLNGAPIREARLKHGDLISIGDVDLRFQDAGGIETAVSAPTFIARKSRRLLLIAVWVVLGAILAVAFVSFVLRLLDR